MPRLLVWLGSLCIAALPTVVADGALVVGPAALDFRNGHASDCFDPSGLCLASGNLSSLGESRVDASQQFYFVGVGLNDSAVEQRGYDLLPDGGLRIDARDFVIRHQLFRFYVEHVGTQHGPGPLSPYGVVMDENHFAIEYFGPSVHDALGAHEPRAIVQEFHEEGIGYDSISPIEARDNATTDEYVAAVGMAPCMALSIDNCTDSMAALSDAIARATPAAAIGFGFYEAGLNTPPALLTNTTIVEREWASGAADRSVAKPPAGRPHASLPPLPLLIGNFPKPPVAPPLNPAGHDEPGRGFAPQTIELDPPIRPSTPLAPLAAAFALAVALAALFSRFRRREDALHNARRLQFLAVLEERGPLTYAQVADALGVDRSTVVHHAAILVRTKNVFTQRCGKYLYVALPGQQVAQARTPQDVADAILATLRERGGTLPRAELHATIGSLYPLRSRNQGLRRLAQRGAIERSFQGATEVIRLVAPQSL